MLHLLFYFKRLLILLIALLGFKMLLSNVSQNTPLTLDPVTTNCFLSVFKQADRIFFSIPDSVLYRDILVATRIVKNERSGTQSRLELDSYPGALTLENVVRFSKKSNGNIVLQLISYERHSTARPGWRKIQRNNRIVDLMEFPQSKLATNAIDVTSLLNGFNDILFINDYSKTILNIRDTSLIVSNINSMRGHALNLEIGTATRSLENKPLFELNTSLILLPKIPMRPRCYNSSLNFFKQGVTWFNGTTENSDSILITKWRIEPRKPDIIKYKRGELVEPEKPIVYYIDPEVPDNWMLYFKKAVTAWNIAFEKAGFKNAIIAKEIDKQDKNFSLYDAQNSVIHLVNSEIKNGTYYTIVDPRSGEIIQSHIVISTGGIQLQFENYFVQASPSDPQARKHVYSDTLLGLLMQEYISHEVGHSLGLDHNMIASDYTPVEKLRDNKWLVANGGHTISIMDYARFNYVAQPGDEVSAKGLIRSIGTYDLWAIKWGYTFFPGNISLAAENERLATWINRNASDKRYRFYKGNDPRATSEALSNDLVQAADYGVKNLKFVVSQMVDWIKSSGGKSDDISVLYNRVLFQLETYVRHVSANIGGVYDTIGVFSGGFVPGNIQDRALDFLDRQIFNTPLWLKDPQVVKHVKSPDSVISVIQAAAIGSILTTKTLVNLLAAQTRPALKISSPADYLHKVHKLLCSDLNTTQPVDKFKQNLQLKYAQILITFLRPYSRWNWPEGTTMETYSAITSLIKDQITIFQNDVREAIQKKNDPESLEHLTRIQNVINIK